MRLTLLIFVILHNNLHVSLHLLKKSNLHCYFDKTIFMPKYKNPKENLELL
jgi:hypothetical protein